MSKDQPFNNLMAESDSFRARQALGMIRQVSLGRVSDSEMTSNARLVAKTLSDETNDFFDNGSDSKSLTKWRACMTKLQERKWNTFHEIPEDDDEFLDVDDDDKRTSYQKMGEEDDELKRDITETSFGTASQESLNLDKIEKGGTKSRTKLEPRRRMTKRSSLALQRDKLSKFFEQKFYKYVSLIVTHNALQTLTSLATIWALFGPELQLIAFDKNDDFTFSAIMLGVFFLFVFELILLSIAQPHTYRFKFFFWMDVLAIISLFPEFLPVFGVNTTGLNSLTVARVGRAVRAAARTARFARVVKVFELAKRRQRYTQRLQWIDADGIVYEKDCNPEETTEEQTNYDEITDQLIEPSQVGEKVKDLAFQKLFILVLVLFISFTVLDPFIFSNTLRSHADVELENLQKLYTVDSGGATFVAVKNHYLEQYDGAVISLILTGTGNSKDKVYPPDNNDLKELGRLREIEILTVECKAEHCEAKYNVREDIIVAAWLSLSLTIAVIGFLMITQGLLANDLDGLVIRPIERMVAVIKVLALNPLATLTIKQDFEFETGLVEAMLTKVGALLQIGFGVAGTSIIQRNLSVSGDVTPMVKGQRVDAVFGFCDIRNFTPATEELQEEVMLFVNHIAEIVHHAVVRNGGFPNHNVGDAFLLVWPLPKNAGKKSLEAASAGALKAFIEVRDRLRRDSVVHNMLRRLPTMRHLRMGFGLHRGWAIVGAIGSRMKVDASYLSPHVNLSSRLEAATKQFGVDILMSEMFVNGLPDDVKETIVKIDRVTVKGSAVPIDLYAGGTERTKASGRLKEEEWLSKSPIPFIEFKNEFETCVELYTQGNWKEATEMLEVLKKARPQFKPTLVLLKAMDGLLSPPPDFKGYHRLDSK